MLDSPVIAEIAGKVARTWIPDAGLERVLTETATDSEGNDALRITLVLKPEAVHRMTGDQAIDVLVGIRRALEDEGEERFPIIEYATEEELEAEDSSEQAD